MLAEIHLELSPPSSVVNEVAFFSRESGLAWNDEGDLTMTSCLVCLDENVSMPEELKIPILGLQVEKDDEQQVYT